DYNIVQCQGCFSCWFKTPGKCILHDDMKQLLKLYKESDIVCFATPIYTWNMTALLKNFVDRLIPLKSPKITESQGNFDLENSEVKLQKFVVISNCGFPGENNFDVLHTSVACCSPSLEIYRSCGKLLKSKDPSVSSIVSNWLKIVESAGREMVFKGSVNNNTLTSLSTPLMPVQKYIEYIGFQ
ncbi:MAG: flavodoxin family protein, partial [Clostridiales bacterium]|nr:flavodoxin family protein [Clostridiales bacterium]